MPARRLSSLTICQRASAGPCRRPPTLVVGDVGDQDLVRTLVKKHGITAIIHFAGSIVVPEFGRRSAWLLQQQHVEVALPDRGCGRNRREAVHLLVDGRRLRQSERDARQRGRRLEAGVALRHLEAHDGADARRHVARPRFPLCRASLLQCRRRRPEGARPASRPRVRPISSRSPARRLSASAGTWRSSAPTTRRRTAPAFATTFTSPISCAPTSRRLPICERAAPPTSSTAAIRAAIPCSRSSPR